MKERSDYVLWFHECGQDMVSCVGGKNASLGKLLSDDIPVPPGYAVTTAAYQRFLKHSHIQDEIFSLLHGINAEDTNTGETASRHIRELIEKTDVEADIEDYICEFYRQLSKQCHLPAVPVAVRSSATAEDLPGASFAGQQDTFLWIRGADDLMKHVKKCWSSLFTPRAIAYRAKMGFPHESVLISVGVQKMVNSWTAGVMFTLNPANGDTSTIAIDANWGFGESVVSGECTPDNFVVNKITMEIIKRNVSSKDFYYTTNQESQLVEKHQIPEERKKMQCIIDEEVIELARIGKLIEKHYGKPMDIEWAVDKDLPGTGRVMIVQSRPETVWSGKKAEPIFTPKASALEHIVAGLVAGKKLK